MTRHPIVLVAAVGRNWVIGRDGRMPWHLPGDLAHFRRVTLGHPILMGRRTFDSIGRPLPGRSTTVISASRSFAPDGVVVARDLREGFALADRQAEQLDAESIMVVGGATLYAATIGDAAQLLITEVAASPSGDTFFPAIDPAIWNRAELPNEGPHPDDTLPYRFTRWTRRAAEERQGDMAEIRQRPTVTTFPR